MGRDVDKQVDYFIRHVMKDVVLDWEWKKISVTPMGHVVNGLTQCGPGNHRHVLLLP